MGDSGEDDISSGDKGGQVEGLSGVVQGGVASGADLGVGRVFVVRSRWGGGKLDVSDFG